MTRLPSERPAAPNHRRTVSCAYASLAQALFNGGDPVEIAERVYPGNRAVIETVRRGAVTPLATTTSGAPVSTTLDILGSILSPASVMPYIIANSQNFEFGRAAALSIPVDIAAPAGDFILQGAPIPFSQLSLYATPMSLKKYAMGTVMTRELVIHTHAASFIGRKLAADIALGLESKLLDNVVGSDTRPAGLKYNIAALTADADGDLAGMTNDLGALGAAVAAVGTTIVYIAHPIQWLKLKTRLPASFPFPIFPSAALADGQVAALALEAFAIAGSGDVQISVSRTGAIVMNDVAAPFSTVGTPAAVAAPIRSLEQTDTIGLRLIVDLDWSLKSPSGFAHVENVAWG